MKAKVISRVWWLPKKSKEFNQVQVAGPRPRRLSNPLASCRAGDFEASLYSKEALTHRRVDRDGREGVANHVRACKPKRKHGKMQKYASSRDEATALASFSLIEYFNICYFRTRGTLLHFFTIYRSSILHMLRSDMLELKMIGVDRRRIGWSKV